MEVSSKLSKKLDIANADLVNTVFIFFVIRWSNILFSGSIKERLKKTLTNSSTALRGNSILSKRRKWTIFIIEPGILSMKFHFRVTKWCKSLENICFLFVIYFYQFFRKSLTISFAGRQILGIQNYFSFSFKFF